MTTDSMEKEKMAARGVMVTLAVFIIAVAGTLSYSQENPYALIGAADRGDTAKVKALLQEGCDVNGKSNEFGRTALLYAAMRGHAEIARMLLEKGAEVNIQDKEGMSALMAAVQHFPYPEERNARYVEIIEHLLARGADVNARDNQGRTALMHSVLSFESAKPLRILLEHGADVSVRDQGSNTVMTYAVRYNRLIALRVLERYGFSPFNSGDVSLDFLAAVELGVVNIARGMLIGGGDVNAKDEFDNTALSIACENGNVPLVKILLENGAALNAKDRQGMTPLIHAVIGGNVNVVKLLLKKGVYIDVKDMYNQTALNLAVDKKNNEMIRLLKDEAAKR